MSTIESPIITLVAGVISAKRATACSKSPVKGLRQLHSFSSCGQKKKASIRAPSSSSSRSNLACRALSRYRADSRPPPRASPRHSSGATPRARRAARETPPNGSRIGAPASFRSECRRDRERPCAGRLQWEAESFRHHSNAHGQIRRRDRNPSPVPGWPGYNTGMDFLNLYECSLGPPWRNNLCEADPPA